MEDALASVRASLMQHSRERAASLLGKSKAADEQTQPLHPHSYKYMSSSNGGGKHALQPACSPPAQRSSTSISLSPPDELIFCESPVEDGGRKRGRGRTPAVALSSGCGGLTSSLSLRADSSSPLSPSPSASLRRHGSHSQPAITSPFTPAVATGTTTGRTTATRTSLVLSSGGGSVVGFTGSRRASVRDPLGLSSAYSRPLSTASLNGAGGRPASGSVVSAASGTRRRSRSDSASLRTATTAALATATATAAAAGDIRNNTGELAVYDAGLAEAMINTAQRMTVAEKEDKRQREAALLRGSTNRVRRPSSVSLALAQGTAPPSSTRVASSGLCAAPTASFEGKSEGVVDEYGSYYPPQLLSLTSGRGGGCSHPPMGRTASGLASRTRGSMPSTAAETPLPTVWDVNPYTPNPSTTTNFAATPAAAGRPPATPVAASSLSLSSRQGVFSALAVAASPGGVSLSPYTPGLSPTTPDSRPNRQSQHHHHQHRQQHSQQLSHKVLTDAFYVNRLAGVMAQDAYLHFLAEGQRGGGGKTQRSRHRSTAGGTGLAAATCIGRHAEKGQESAAGRQRELQLLETQYLMVMGHLCTSPMESSTTPTMKATATRVATTDRRSHASRRSPSSLVGGPAQWPATAEHISWTPASSAAPLTSPLLSVVPHEPPPATASAVANPRDAIQQQQKNVHRPVTSIDPPLARHGIAAGFLPRSPPSSPSAASFLTVSSIRAGSEVPLDQPAAPALRASPTTATTTPPQTVPREELRVPFPHLSAMAKETEGPLYTSNSALAMDRVQELMRASFKIYQASLTAP